jgi:hypothetical protein
MPRTEITVKVGTSLGKCLRDLLAGDVGLDEVFCIVSNTRCETLDDVLRVVAHYHAVSPGHRDRDISHWTLEQCQDMAKKIWSAGLLHQPRVTTPIHQHLDTDTWMDLVPSADTGHPSVQQAWKEYCMISKLANGHS